MRWLGMDEPSGRKMFLTLVLIVIGLIMAISLVIALRYRAPRPDAAARLYARFIRQSGLEPETGETARLFAARVREVGQLPAATVDEITAAYLDARYGRDDAGASEPLYTLVGFIAAENAGEDE